MIPARDSAVPSTDLVALIIPVKVGSGRIRLHLTGPRPGIRAALEELSHLCCLANDAAALLDDFAPILDAYDVVLADVLDAGETAAPAVPLVDLLRWARESTTAARAFAVMEMAFADASGDEIARLLDSADLPWVRDLAETVLTGLHDGEAAARTTLAEIAPGLLPTADRAGSLRTAE